ncbi:MAG: prolipoprotein diacylglyceryl transferase family protein [Planctomycetota bacterium]
MMMFLTILGLVTLVPLILGIRKLAGDRWQVLASIPLHSNPDGTWEAGNFTWYGFISASAYALSVSVLWILLLALEFQFSEAVILITAVMAVVIPSSRKIAQWIEGRKNTFSIGAAAFVGMILCPLLLFIVSQLELYGRPLPILEATAAFTIAYSFGEGLGRLACISFGCCYGKPVDELTGITQRIFRPLKITYNSMETRKVQYDSGYSQRPLVAIPAITAVLCTVTGLISTALFLSGNFVFALLLSLGVTQIWRFGSEFLRSDYRGDNSISAYQWMALLGLFGAIVFVSSVSTTGVVPDLDNALTMVWQPGPILVTQGLWLFIFFFMGWSDVTSSTVSLHLCRNKVEEAV